MAQGLAQLTDRIHRTAFAERRPVAGMLALTYRCNLACRHCYLANERATAEMSVEKWHDLLGQLREAGCLWLALSGGEPLLRADFAAIYREAKRLGFLVTVFTNGTLVDEKVLTLFREWPPFKVEVSLYGASAESYRAVTGSGEAYRAAHAAVRNLVGQGTRVELKAMALRQNVAEVPRLQTLADELGLRFRYDPDVTPALDGSDAPCAARLSPEAILALDLRDAKRREAWVERFRAGRQTVRSTLFNCAGGQTSFFVSPDGRLALCSTDRPVADLTRETFLEGWSGPLRDRRATRLPVGHPCIACEQQVVCGVCPPLAKMETGEETGVPEARCRQALLLRRELSPWLETGGRE